jgi:hypothetical protein
VRMPSLSVPWKRWSAATWRPQVSNAALPQEADAKVMANTFGAGGARANRLAGRT